MRMRLVGYSGERPPVPGTEVVDPEDPGPIPDPPLDPDDIPPPLLLSLAHGAVFHKATYLAMGYNRFDVMCIGAAGGRAGNLLQTAPPDVPLDHGVIPHYRQLFGAAGGGGGVHRIKGRLALLPTNVPVVVGAAGANGGDAQYTEKFWSQFPARTIPSGSDGGISSFGATICRASGGKGGNYVTGGGGGLGNREAAGGGPAPAWLSGGVDPDSHTPFPLVPNPGKWTGVIGAGGAGGEGSIVDTLRGYATGTYLGGEPVLPTYIQEHQLSTVYTKSPPPNLQAADGADGAFSVADSGVRGKGQAAGILYISQYSGAFTWPVLAGPGGGATAFPLNGLLTQYGSRAAGANPNGAVIIRLTYAIV